MEQAGVDDLFETRVSITGKVYIRKFAVIARITIIIGIVISLIHIASTILRYINIDVSDYTGYEYLQLEHELLPYYTIAYCFLFYPQMFLYWQVTKYLKKGLDYNDETVFNKAFQSLFRYSVWGVASILLSTLSYGFELYVFIKYYVK